MAQSSAPVRGKSGEGNELASSNAGYLLQRIGVVTAVFAVVVQQGAFVSSPVLGNLVTASSNTEANILNSLAVFLNIVLLAPLCVLHRRQLAPIIYGNKVAIALIVLMFLSVSWSVHPDVTLRRGVNYFSTILTACYLAGRFDVDEMMKILSWGIAISAVCSFLFVVAFPVDAVHQPSPWQGEEITGAWKGVFAHKNVLGHTMTVGVIVELYILTDKARTIWHVILLCACSALVILSRSDHRNNTCILLPTWIKPSVSIAARKTIFSHRLGNACGSRIDDRRYSFGLSKFRLGGFGERRHLDRANGALGIGTAAYFGEAAIRLGLLGHVVANRRYYDSRIQGCRLDGAASSQCSA